MCVCVYIYMYNIHQTSIHKAETNAFLLVAFLCSLVYSRLRTKKSFKELNFNKKHIALAAVCGICTYAMNVLNLKLSGILPSQLFFPLVNGSAIVLSSLLSVTVFKEKLSKKQLFGLCGGTLSLMLICIGCLPQKKRVKPILRSWRHNLVLRPTRSFFCAVRQEI